MIKSLSLFIALFCTSTLIAQVNSTIEFTNPSFEDTAREGAGDGPYQAPRAWKNCGFSQESPPDIHPVLNGQFKVIQAPYDGLTYLGMVVRDNDTYESIGQPLVEPLEAGQCYEFSVHLARSEAYHSQSKKLNTAANYTTPATLRVWGGNGACDKRELLYVTKAVTHKRWIKYTCRFKPKKQYRYIRLEAYYKTPSLFAYNGNILVDNLSPIQTVICNEEDLAEVDIPDEDVQAAPLLTEERPRVIDPVAKTPSPKPTTPTPTKPTPVESTPQPERTLAGVRRTELRAGQTIRINDLYFQANQSEIQGNSYTSLDEISDFLNSNQEIIVEIGGHTNGTPAHNFCDSLSTLRAKFVADYLVQKGVNEKQLTYKGYGKRNPVASNRTPTGRKRNQRVEIKVLALKAD